MVCMEALEAEAESVCVCVRERERLHGRMCVGEYGCMCERECVCVFTISLLCTQTYT